MIDVQAQKATHRTPPRLLLLLSGLLLSGLFGVPRSSLAAEDQWARRADMLLPRGGTAASTVYGQIYVIGGMGLFASRSVQAYDPVNDKWTRKANMPTARWALSASEVNGVIYVFGGTQQNNRLPISAVEAYNPVTDTWTKKTDMPIPLTGMSTCAVNGKIYVIGGSNFWQIIPVPTTRRKST